MSKILTTCGYCGCGCGLIFETKKNKILNVIPSKKNIVSKGKICVKGWHGHNFVDNKNRLTSPLIKENGVFKKVTFKKAYQKIKNNFLKIMDKKDNTEIIGVLGSSRCTNEENYLTAKLARMALKTSSIDNCARLWHSSTIASLAKSFGNGAMTNSIDDLFYSDCIIVIGSNTTEQHPMVANRIIENKINNNSKIIVIDPRRIRIAEYANIYSPINLGTNLLLIKAIIYIIIDKNLINKNFINKKTEGYSDFCKFVSKNDLIKAIKKTGISKEVIKKIAYMYAKSKKASIVFAMGVTQHISGTDTVTAIANLAMLTGNIGRKGTGIYPLRGQNNVQGACDMGVLPTDFPGYNKVIEKKNKKKFKNIWGNDISSKIGYTSIEMFSKILENKMKALYIIGENPVISEPNNNHIIKSLKKLSFLVVQDIFLTETAKYADVILPGASFLEKNGTFTNTERRIQKVNKVIKPIKKSREDWKILNDVIYLFTKKKFNNLKDIMKEINETVYIYSGITYETVYIYSGITYEKINKNGIQWPCTKKNILGTSILHKKNFTRGKGLFIDNNSKFKYSIVSKKYPFSMTTGRISYHYHTRSMTKYNWNLEREINKSFIEINKEDAKKLNLFDKEKVKVSSKMGSLITNVHLTDKIKKGIVFMPFHFNESIVNMLTNEKKRDNISQMPQLKAFAVKIERII